MKMGAVSKGWAHAWLLGAVSTVAIIAGAADQRAHAQSVPAGDQPSAAMPAAGAVEEIVVHARKREEKAAEVPLAITAVSGEALKNQSVTQIQDLTRIAPNVLVHPSTDTGGTLLAEIRGQISSISSFAVDSPVGFYFDDVYIAESKGLAGSIFDVQDVEIARGVQGTLNGRNNTGGAISFYTVKPVFGEYQAEVSGTAGTENLFGGHVIVNLPVNDTLALRFGYQKMQQDGEGRSVVTNEQFQGIGQEVWRASALWNPTDALSLHLVYEGTGLNQQPISFKELPGSLIVGALENGIQSPLNPPGARIPASTLFPSNFYDNALNSTQNDVVQSQFVHGTLSYDILDNLQAKLTAGYRYMKAVSGYDVDASPIPFIQATNFGGTSRQITLEPQLSGKLFDERLHWVVGYFHFSDSGTYRSTTYAESINAANLAHPFVNQLLIDDAGKNISDAGYAHGEYGLTDDWKVAAGVRYTQDQRAVFPGSATNFAYPLGAAYGAYKAGLAPALQCRLPGFKGPCPSIELSQDYHYISYEFSTHYDIDENWHLYARTGKGQKSGGFNVPVNSATDAPFQPEEVTDYEIGVKAIGLLDGTLGFNADYFYGDYKQMQRLISTVLPGGGGVALQVINAGSATVQGTEFDFNWRPVPPLTISGYAGYTFAQYDQFTSTDGVNTFDLKNEPFYQTPKWTGRLAAAYDIPTDYGDVRLSGGVNYVGSQSFLALYFPSATQAAYALFDARVSWTNPDDTLEVALWGTNLADRHYYVSGQGSRATPNPASTPTYGVLVPGMERSVGATFTYKFSSPTAEGAPAPAAHVPPPAAAPALAPRSYLVFFDFNKSDLTPQAVQIVDEAAKNAGPAKATLLTVTGHTDTVGSDAYNMRLSRRRAESVAAQLEKDGIPLSEIQIVAKGKRDLLVPTADGVKEPQNRRVQIVYDGGVSS